MPTVTGPIPVAVTGLVVIPAAGLLAVAALVAVIVLELPAPRPVVAMLVVVAGGAAPRHVHRAESRLPVAGTVSQ